MKKREKKPVVAWVVKVDGCDNFGLYGARTERGALGFSRRQAREAGWSERLPSEFRMDIERCGPMDDWIRAQKHLQGWDLQIALYQAQDARKDAARAAMAATFVAMRKEGLGLSMGQEEMLQRGLEVP